MTDNCGRTINYLRVSVTDRCNQRCRYCMPEDGIPLRSHDEMLTEEETLRICRSAAALGFNKIRITGGEPLLKKNIISLCENISSIPGITDLSITTNGTLLESMAPQLVNAGVKRVNISLDTLNRDKYASMARADNFEACMRGLRAALACGFEKVKINTVLIGGFNEDEIVDLAELTRLYPLDVRFIELMPMLSGAFSGSAFLSCDTVKNLLPEAADAGRDGVAKLLRLPDSKGYVGLISPLSDHFCPTCSRIRLTADGKLKPCLHSSTELPVKGLSDDQIRLKLLEAIALKPKAHNLLSGNDLSEASRTMNEIGG